MLGGTNSRRVGHVGPSMDTRFWILRPKEQKADYRFVDGMGRKTGSIQMKRYGRPLMNRKKDAENRHGGNLGIVGAKVRNEKRKLGNIGLVRRHFSVTMFYSCVYHSRFNGKPPWNQCTKRSHIRTCSNCRETVANRGKNRVDRFLL